MYHIIQVQSNNIPLKQNSLLKDICSGLFQNRTVYISGQSFLKSGDVHFEEQIVRFYSCLFELSSRISFCYSHIVYRGVRDIKLNDVDFLYHPIPFSTSLSKEFAQNWAGECGLVFEILVENVPFVYVGNGIEEEIMLPEGFLRWNKKTNNLQKIKCLFSYK